MGENIYLKFELRERIVSRGTFMGGGALSIHTLQQNLMICSKKNK
jgi:hypothetical protein